MGTSRDEDTPLRERLNELFATVPDVSRGAPREFSTPYVARAISDDPSHGTTLSRVYLNGLRNGTNTNPTISVVRALAKFFDERRAPRTPPITVARLVGEVGADERELLATLADEQVRAIALRASAMDTHTRRQVLRMLDVLDPAHMH